MGITFKVECTKYYLTDQRLNDILFKTCSMKCLVCNDVVISAENFFDLRMSMEDEL